MAGYGGPNGPDGSKKSGNQGGAQGNGNNGAGTGVGSGNGQKSWGGQIADLFGGQTGYNNNPNAPHYNTKTMGVPINMPLSQVPFGPNYGMPNPLGYGVGLMGLGSIGIGPAMMGTRAMQALTGMSGGPSIGGRDDGMGAFGGHGGTANGGISGGGMNPSQSGYQLPPGYMMQPQAPVTPPATPPSYSMVNQGSQYLSPTPGYGVETPAYSYFGPMSTPQSKEQIMGLPFTTGRSQGFR